MVVGEFIEVLAVVIVQGFMVPGEGVFEDIPLEESFDAVF